MGTEEQSKSNEDIVVKLNKYFLYALDHPTWVAGRKNMLKTFEYKEGKQWSADELSTLNDRGQPDTVNNQIAVTVNKLVGDFVDQKFRIGFRGRNSMVDDTVANTLSDIFLYVRQSNDLEYEEKDMAEDGFTCGMGVLEVFVTFDDMFQPEIKVRSEDALVVFPDPDSKRYDWNQDAKFVCRAKWFDLDEAKELYPKAKGQLEGLVTEASAFAASGQLADVEGFKAENYVDQNRRRVRIIEVEYKKYKREVITLFANGSSLRKEQVTKEMLAQADAENTAYEDIERVRPIICRGVFAADILLDHKETKRKFFSLIPYWVYRKKSGEPYSLITLALSMQDAINKRESKALHLLNTNQIIGETNSIGDKETVASELAKPDGVVELPNGALQNKSVLFRNNIELSQAQFAMHEKAQLDFYRITSVDPRTYTSTGELRSGAGVKAKFQEAAKPLVPIFDNLKRTRKIASHVILDYIQNYWTGEKTFLVTDDAKKAREVTIDAPLMQKLKTSQYDVVVDDFVDTATLQQEQAALLMQYLPQILQFGPYWAKKIIMLSDLRDKEQFVQEMEQQGKPPPVQPKIAISATLDALPPEERAFFYETMGNPQLAEEVRNNDRPASGTVKAAVDISKEKIKGDHAAVSEKIKSDREAALEEVKNEATK
jgi:hypothetical protein